jgi:hypothetical protein
MPDRRQRHGLLAQHAQYPQLTQILKTVALLLSNELSPLPPLQLTGTNLQDAQYVLAAIAGHSSLLPCASGKASEL